MIATTIPRITHFYHVRVLRSENDAVSHYPFVGSEQLAALGRKAKVVLLSGLVLFAWDAISPILLSSFDYEPKTAAEVPIVSPSSGTVIGLFDYEPLELVVRLLMSLFTSLLLFLLLARLRPTSLLGTLKWTSLLGFLVVAVASFGELPTMGHPWQYALAVMYAVFGLASAGTVTWLLYGCHNCLTYYVGREEDEVIDRRISSGRAF